MPELYTIEPEDFANSAPVQAAEGIETPAPTGGGGYTAASFETIVQEQRTVSDNDDEATAATVKMMADYIKQGVTDPVCQKWAHDAVFQFGNRQRTPLALVWSVFWKLKHCVKLTRDETVLFHIGQKNARDLLIAPAVLVRQLVPKEDCDGFTMLCCTLLEILGLKPYIVTVKADARRPGEWSHVFCMVDLPDGERIPIDSSHGPFPGWMIPRRDIFAVQLWDMNGNPVAGGLPEPRVSKRSRLNGYVKTGRGVGFLDPSTPGAVPTSDPSGWFSVLDTLIKTAGQVATVAEAPAGATVFGQNGQFVTAPGGTTTSAFVTAGTSNALPWILGGVALFVVAVSMARK